MGNVPRGTFFAGENRAGKDSRNQQGGEHCYEDERALKNRGKTECVIVSMVSSVGNCGITHRHLGGSGGNQHPGCPVLVVALGDFGLPGTLGCGAFGLFFQKIPKKIARNQLISCYFY